MTREFSCAEYNCYESTEAGRRCSSPDAPAKADVVVRSSNGPNALSGFDATL